MNYKTNIVLAAVMAALTIASPASAATVLFVDNFDTARDLNTGFNDGAALNADQSGTAAPQTYNTFLNNTGSNYAYQRGNGGTWLMFANGGEGGATDMRGSLNYDIAAAANSLNSALEISFNMSVSNPLGGDGTLWTSFTIGNQNPFVNEGLVGFGALFRDNGQTQQFSNGGAIGSSATFSDGNLISFVISDATGSGSAFKSDGSNDMVQMFINGSLADSFTSLNLDTSDQFISFNANGTVANIDNLTVTAVPEPSVAFVGGLGLLALLRRRKKKAC